MRIHLAMGGFTPDLQPPMKAAHPYGLTSYFYLKDFKDPRDVMLRFSNGDPENLIVDSGLYSFMFGSEQGKMPSTYEAYRDYTRKYLDDMADWGFDCYLVEADAQRILGMESTFRLREEFKPLGSRVMYVWHQPEGLDGLVKLAREVDYIGIGLPELRMIALGGSTVGQSTIVDKMCNDLLRRIHAACGDSPPRIHLLGCTTPRLMETTLAWSCDSTTWLMGLRYGNGPIWTSTDGLQRKGIRSAKFLKFRELAMDANPESVKYAQTRDNPDYILNGLACGHAYKLYQAWLDSRYSPVPMRGDALPDGAM